MNLLVTAARCARRIRSQSGDLYLPERWRQPGCGAGLCRHPAALPDQDITSRTEASLWRYLPLLPVATRVVRAHRCAPPAGRRSISLTAWRKRCGLKNLWIKDEGRNPTASFKDRASAVVVARAREIGAEVMVTASTGNAGAALAGMAAAVGQKRSSLRPKPHRRPKWPSCWSLARR